MASFTDGWGASILLWLVILATVVLGIGVAIGKFLL
jgi:hypothetical protein